MKIKKRKVSIIHRSGGRVVHLRKGWDLKHGFGWFCVIYEDYEIGFGFSKNKFTSFRLALKELAKSF